MKNICENCGRTRKEHNRGIFKNKRIYYIDNAPIPFSSAKRVCKFKIKTLKGGKA